MTARRPGRWLSLRVGRDTAVVTVALALSVWEIMAGGARPAVLSFLAALLLSPLVMRVDEARRRNGGGARR